jgi:hypothetical protein
VIGVVHQYSFATWDAANQRIIGQFDTSGASAPIIDNRKPDVDGPAMSLELSYPIQIRATAFSRDHNMRILNTMAARAIPLVPRSLIRKISRRYIASARTVTSFHCRHARAAYTTSATIEPSDDHPPPRRKTSGNIATYAPVPCADNC